MKEKFEALVDHLVSNGFFLEEVVELLERTLIEKTLERTGGTVRRPASGWGFIAILCSARWPSITWVRVSPHDEAQTRSRRNAHTQESRHGVALRQ